MATKEKKSSSVSTDKFKPAEVDRCKRENSMNSKMLEKELQSIQRQQQIWLKQQAAEAKKYKSKLDSPQKAKRRTLSLPSNSTNERLFSTSLYKRSQIKRKDTIC